MLADVIVIAILAAVSAGIVAYLIREKRRGVKCIGCPYAKECAKKSCASQEGAEK